MHDAAKLWFTHISFRLLILSVVSSRSESCLQLISCLESSQPAPFRSRLTTKHKQERAGHEMSSLQPTPWLVKCVKNVVPYIAQMCLLLHNWHCLENNTSKLVICRSQILSKIYIRKNDHRILYRNVHSLGKNGGKIVRKTCPAMCLVLIVSRPRVHLTILQITVNVLKFP